MLFEASWPSAQPDRHKQAADSPLHKGAIAFTIDHEKEEKE